jgi:hypothetical protein
VTTSNSSILDHYHQLKKSEPGSLNHHLSAQAILDAAKPYLAKYPLSPLSDVKSEAARVDFVISLTHNDIVAREAAKSDPDQQCAREMYRLQERHMATSGSINRGQDLESWLDYIDFCTNYLQEAMRFDLRQIEMMSEAEIVEVALMVARLIEPFAHPLLALIAT